MSKYVPEYEKRVIRYTVKYGLNDLEEGQRLKDYLTDTHQTVNGYLKKVIKADLDRKGV